MDNNYDQQITNSLEQMPADREAIRNSAESIGRSLGSKSAGTLPAKDVVTAFESGLKTGYGSQWDGQHSDR